MANFLTRRLRIEDGEEKSVAVFFAHYFLVSAAAIAGKSARDAFFLSEFDRGLLPAMYLANAVAVAGAMAAFPRVVRRFSPVAGVALVLGFFAATLMLLGLRPGGWATAVLYVWMEVIGAVVILQAWLLAGNAFNPRQAKRLFGIIAAGGSIAAWAGGSSISWIASRFGSASLILLVALALGLSIGTGWLGSRLAAPQPATPTRPATAKPSRWNPGPYVGSIALLIAGAAIVSAIVQYRFQAASAAMCPSRDEMVAFFGQFYAWTGAASLFSQLFLPSFLLSRFGVAAGLFVLPAFFSASLMFNLLSPALWSAALGRFSDLTFKFTVNNSSLEMLWLPVPAAERTAAKPVISGTVKSVCEAAAAILMLVLVQWTPAWVLTVFALTICAAWLITVVRVKSLYRAALARVIEKRQLNSDTLRINPEDSAVAQALRQSLASHDEAEQLAALGFLDGFPLAPWFPALRQAYHHGSAGIRERILSLAAHQPGLISDAELLEAISATTAWSPAAIRASIQLGVPGAEPLVARILDGPDFHRGIAAASAILTSNRGDTPAALRCLERWLDVGPPAAVAAALRALPAGAAVADAKRIGALLGSPHADVRRAALEAAATLQLSALTPEVASLLADRRCVLQARLTLRRMPDLLVVQALHQILRAAPTPPRLRRAVLRTLRDYPDLASEHLAITQAHIDDLPGYLDSVKFLHRIRQARPIDAGVLERLRQDGGAIRTGAYLWDGLKDELNGDTDALLLHDHLDYRRSQAVETTLRLTVLDDPAFPVGACIRAVESGDPALLPYALELVDTAVPVEDRRMLAPLIDRSQASRRLELRRVLLPAGEKGLDARLGGAFPSADDWGAAVAADYLRRKRQPCLPSPSGEPPRRTPLLSTLEKTIILKASSLFSAIPGENLAKLAAIAVESSWPQGSAVFHDGDPGDALFLIVSGSVRILKNGIPIATLARGACFGEMAVLDGSTRSAGAIVEDEAVLLRISSEDFYDALAETPELTQALFRLLSRRLRDANARLAQVDC